MAGGSMSRPPATDFVASKPAESVSRPLRKTPSIRHRGSCPPDVLPGSLGLRSALRPSGSRGLAALLATKGPHMDPTVTTTYPDCDCFECLFRKENRSLRDRATSLAFDVAPALIYASAVVLAWALGRRQRR
jgi:hypothetical protein